MTCTESSRHAGVPAGPRSASTRCGSDTGIRTIGPWIHRDLSFELPPGGLTAIVGPSGSRQVHHLRAAASASTSPRVGQHHGRRPGHPGLAAAGAAGHDRLRRAGRAVPRRHASGEPLPCGSGRHRRGVASGRRADPAGRPARPPAGGPGHARSAIVAARCPAANASASRSPVRCCAVPGSCCWTRRHRSSTRSTSPALREVVDAVAAPPRSWWSRTGCPLCSVRTASSSSTAAACARPAPTKRCLARTSSIASSRHAASRHGVISNHIK